MHCSQACYRLIKLTLQAAACPRTQPCERPHIRVANMRHLSDGQAVCRRSNVSNV